LLAEANKKLNLATDQVKDILDILYRKLALITYPRTDSCRIDIPMCIKFREQLKNKFPIEDISKEEPEELFFNKKKSKGQDGHAAITPVKLENTPEFVKNKMEDGKSFSKEDMFLLYKMIYERTIYAFFKPSINESLKYHFSNNGNNFSSSFSRVKYLG
jgi:DNA topoisomerase-1